MDSSSPDSLSSHSRLDTPAGNVRQRLLFDCHETRFGESAEPDPLSFGSPQRAGSAQHAHQAEQHDLGAMSSSFQVHSALAMHKTVSKGTLQSTVTVIICCNTHKHLKDPVHAW